MPRPICVKCQREMSCEKNDFLVNDPQVGGFPPTFWWGDKYQCPRCEVEVVVPGFGKGFVMVPEDVAGAKSLGFTRE